MAGPARAGELIGGAGVARAAAQRKTRSVTARSLVVVLAFVLVVGCGGTATKESRPQPALTLKGGPSGGRFDVGGHSLYLECAGSGSPTVVLEAGFGGASQDWANVAPALGLTTRTCAYDRAGLGASDPIPGVHDPRDEVRDLARLLRRARIPSPYVLVGHSYGGLLVRLFAHAHPHETGGVVLVDALGRNAYRRELAAWPPSIAPVLRRQLAAPVYQGIDVRPGVALDDRIRSLGDVPLIVITAAHERQLAGGVPPWLYRRGMRLWSRMQAELARLSGDRAHVVALRSDHFVQDDQPDVVIRAVEAVVRAERGGAPLPPCARLFTGPDVRCLT